MSQIRFVSGVKNRRKIVDTSAKARRLDTRIVAKAFSARAVGSSKGLDLFAVRASMERMLQSSGGRPSLEGAVPKEFTGR